MLSAPAYLFFFNDTATTEIYTLSLHDALPISSRLARRQKAAALVARLADEAEAAAARRSEEHTSELQSPCNLVCRLLLEKKNEQVDPFRVPVHRQSARPEVGRHAHLLLRRGAR